MSTEIIMGMALAGTAGLNAFVPLLALAFAHRLSDRVHIGAHYTWLSSSVGLVVTLLLLPIELFVDKAPGWDTVNDRAARFYRPIAGALIMLATTADSNLHPILAAIIGAAIALGMHTLKTRYRHPLTQVFAGIPTPIASAVEDFCAALVCFLALLWPIVGFVALIVVAAVTWRLGSVVRRRVARANLDTSSVTAAQT